MVARLEIGEGGAAKEGLILRRLGTNEARRAGLMVTAALALLVGIIAATGDRSAIHHHPLLALTLQIIFVLAPSVAVAVVSARAYLRSGSPSILLLGAALLLSGVSVTVSVWARSPGLLLSLTPNGAVTVGNLGLLASSIVLFTSGLAVLIGTWSTRPHLRRTILSCAYLAALVFVPVISAAADLQALPDFMIGAGPTDLRIAVLTGGVVLCFLSGLLYTLRYLRSRSDIYYWVTLGIILMGLCMVASVFVMSLESEVNWIGRSALYASGVCFVIALLGRERTASSVTERWGDAFSMDSGKVASLSDNIETPIIHGKLVRDDQGRPVDLLLFYMNRAFEREAGVKRVDCLGRGLSEALSDPHYGSPRWLRPYELAMRDQAVSSYNWLSPKGRKWHRVSVYALHKDQFIAIGEDITDRKRAEEALKESEAKYRGLFENLQIPIDVNRNLFNEQGEIIDGMSVEVNPAWLRAMGFASADEVVGRRLSEMYSPETFRPVREMVNRMSITRAPVTGEVYNDRTDRHYIMTVAPIVMGDTSLTFAARVDITDLKKAQKALEEREKDLRNAQAVSRTGSWRLDLRSWVLQFSEETYRMLGLPPGTPMSYEAFLNIVHPDDRGLVNDRFQAALRGEVCDFEHRSVVNGEVRWFRLTSVLEFDENGAVVSGFGTGQDITERRAMENELLRSNTELQQFAYVASHDLQEPLRMVTAYLTLLEKKYGDRLDGKAREYMNYAVEGGLRARDLIHDLLEFSRIDTRASTFESVDMEELLGRALDNLSVQIKDEAATISHDPLPAIMADRTQIAQVLQNLLNNAIKFHGDEPPMVRVSVQDKGREWLFSVQDNGIGIDPIYKDKLFVLFQRLHTREEYPGTGIGLAICKKIVERHGGRIWFESGTDDGTTFNFTIPKGTRDAP